MLAAAFTAAGRGQEFEYAQVTTDANTDISRITDRMPLLLDEDELELWLGELHAPLEDVRSLIRTRDFDPAEWEIGPEDPTKKPPTPRKKARWKSIIRICFRNAGFEPIRALSGEAWAALLRPLVADTERPGLFSGSLPLHSRQAVFARQQQPELLSD